MGHRTFFALSLLAQASLAAAAASALGWRWCVAALAPISLSVAVYLELRQTPYERVLRTSLWGAPLAVLATAWIPGWPGIAARWTAFLVIAGWHHSALQALREWARFETVIGPNAERVSSSSNQSRPAAFRESALADSPD